MSDYIDRQAAIDAIRKDMYADKDYMSAMICDGIEDVLKSLSSADVRPVHHGKWIKAQRKGITSYGDGFAECDKCHEVSWLGWNDKYCRNCGARMDGERK